MRKVFGNNTRFCDGITRRGFLQIGGLAMGGLSLPDILRAEAQTESRRPHKGIIMILLPGGPPHLDMYDMKPEAPVGIRGEFKPIATRVPGIEICELMPRCAAIMDKLILVRSLSDAQSQHSSHQCITGWESHLPATRHTFGPRFSTRGLALSWRGSLETVRTGRSHGASFDQSRPD